ncbi:MAG TPA: pilus assembly protein TadG-related protein [Terracidiphilus sp.]|nr:pilus assembly protein TadG-related protein [Terracidiphilus sp.]
MKTIQKTNLKRLIRYERGQTLVFSALIMVPMLGMSGIALDAGHGYYAYQRLKVATNAAALAGAAGMPDTSVAAANVAAYSSAAGQKNALGTLMTDVVATPTYSCLNTVSTKLNVACASKTGTGTPYNAIAVTQTATVRTWFGQFFGVSQFNISATSTAAMAGGVNQPWNIAIIVDTTGSMNTPDSGAQCSGTRITCALKGVQALLDILYPCTVGQTCTNSGVSPVDSVSLFAFPAFTTGTAKNDYTCPTSNPSSVPYTVQNVSPGYTSYPIPSNLTLPSADTYQIVTFKNDYKTTDGATTLNSSSQTVIAAGGGSCSGIKAPGGQGTYYAEVIYAAEAALEAQQAANPNSKNAMIILTDGDATACNTVLATSGGTTTTNTCSPGGSSQITAASGTLNGTGTKTSNASGYHNPTYPSALGECGQAVQAALDAANAGTTVFTFAYGANNSGCTTDASYSNSVTGGGGSWAAGGSPCQAIAAMASSQANFYSDAANGCKATNSYNQSITTLKGMFQHAAASLTSARLIPNGTT